MKDRGRNEFLRSNEPRSFSREKNCTIFQFSRAMESTQSSSYFLYISSFFFSFFWSNALVPRWRGRYRRGTPVRMNTEESISACRSASPIPSPVSRSRSASVAHWNRNNTIHYCPLPRRDTDVSSENRGYFLVIIDPSPSERNSDKEEIFFTEGN